MSSWKELFLGTLKNEVLNLLNQVKQLLYSYPTQIFTFAYFSPQVATLCTSGFKLSDANTL